MLVTDYIQYDVRGLAQLIKNKEVSANEVLTCAFTRMEEVNPQLNAIVGECAYYAQQCLSNMRGDEPYYGVPLLVKDLGFALKGVRATEGSQFFSNNVSLENSDVITQLISLGFVPFAKTNTPELGLSFVTESTLLGPCRNPYDHARTSGGSSGGSAAAVAAGVAPVATASDGGGSIRIPAACCGLFGFKPTTGLMPQGPWVAESWSGMATNFLLTRTASDAHELFTHFVEQRPIKLKKRIRVSYLEGAFAQVPIAAPYLGAIKKIQEILTDDGHQVDRVRIDLDLESIGECTMTLIAANTCAAIELQCAELGREVRRDELEPITWEFYQRGKFLLAHQLINAKNKLYQLMQPLHQVFRQTDLVLTPALAQLPLLIGELNTSMEFNAYLQKNTEFSPFTALFNQAGLPAMTLPVLFAGNLPISIQLGAAKGKDWLLLHLAQELQSKLPDFSKSKI